MANANRLGRRGGVFFVMPALLRIYLKAIISVTSDINQVSGSASSRDELTL